MNRAGLAAVLGAVGLAYAGAAGADEMDDWFAQYEAICLPAMSASAGEVPEIMQQAGYAPPLPGQVNYTRREKSGIMFFASYFGMEQPVVMRNCMIEIRGLLDVDKLHTLFADRATRSGLEPLETGKPELLFASRIDGATFTYFSLLMTQPHPTLVLTQCVAPGEDAESLQHCPPAKR